MAQAHVIARDRIGCKAQRRTASELEGRALAGIRDPGRAGRETRLTAHGTRRTVRLSGGRAAGRGLINCRNAQTKAARRGTGRLEVQGGE